MDRPKILRRLRITVSALCLLFCVAFMGLWIRSYSWQDYAHCPLPGESVNPASRRTATTGVEPSPRTLAVLSYRGLLSIYAGEQVGISGWFPYGWGFETYYVGNIGEPAPADEPTQKWSYQSHIYGRSARFPHWAPAVVFGALAAAAFGIRRVPVRFSLRTLLITTTLIAVILGLIVWAGGN